MTLTEAALLLYDEYREGRFPMADKADDEGFMIITPRERALLPIKDLHLSRSLLKVVKQNRFKVTHNLAFERVINACAEKVSNRPETWINPDIKILFMELHRLGHAHSIECWHDDTLVGGLYGLAVGGVFCGESMFSRTTDASKVALVHLCARLFNAKFELLDAQFHNDHLEQFGLYLLKQSTYVERLKTLRDMECDFALRTTHQTEQDLIVSYLKNRAA
jgi:leucyl/phenylalanyl-tRNA--protein transferase